MKQNHQHPQAGVGPGALPAKQILQLQEVVRQVVVADHVFAYRADLVRRPGRASRACQVYLRADCLGRRTACQPVT